MQFDLNTYVKLDEKVLAALVTAETTDVTDPSVAFLRSYIFDGCFGLTDGIDKKTAFQEAVLGMKVKDTLCTAKVAVMLAVGSGTARDIRQADKLSRACIEDLEVLAQQGNPYAKCIAGLLYGFGIGMRDKVKGFNYFLSASEQGEPIAQNNLANCYIDGIGTGIDLKQAKRWAMASAYSNYPYGHFTIAQLLEKEGDLQGAVEHYEKAGEQGYVSAMVHAAEYYAFRESPDLQKAFEWFKKASDHGELYAKYAIINLYETNLLNAEQMSLADAFSLYSDLLHDPALKNTSRIRYGSKKAQLLAQAVNTVDENDQPWTPQSQEKWLVFEDGSSAKETRISGATRPTAMKKAKGRKLRR